MKVTRGASQSLSQAQAQKDMKSLKNNKMGAKHAQHAEKNASAQVSLSQKAQQIKKATELAKQDNVDEKKIAFFQNMIDSGKYKVDSAKVADKLVDDHLKMPT